MLSSMVRGRLVLSAVLVVGAGCGGGAAQWDEPSETGAVVPGGAAIPRHGGTEHVPPIDEALAFGGHREADDVDLGQWGSLDELGEIVHAATYPDPPHDFSHPGSYHDTLFSPVGGTLDRPMLVIYVHFSDVPERPGEDTEWVRQRFLGPGFPSVAGWYDTNSFGNLTLFPAAETQGTANDGVVVVDAGAFDSHIGPGISAQQRNRAAMELADPFVDYSVFDSDNDGTLTDAELVVVNVRVAREGFVRKLNGPPCSSFPSTECPEACDYGDGDPCVSWDIGDVANRGVEAGAALDGKTIALNVAIASTACNFMTWTHEITHTVLHLVDLYAFPVGTMDIGGATLDAPDRYPDRNRRLFSASAWSKVHWGWITPFVVSEDGYYDVPAAYTSGEAFILYDPDRGTDDYFIVENRRRLTGTYDQNPSDDGLIIWRIDDQKFNPPSGSSGPDGGPITTRQPNGQQVAWDPSDPESPERTMTSPWRDGTANTLAVRAIGPRGDVIRAFFDVRGPGILVDTYPMGVAGPPQVIAGALEVLPVPVMNTGEASDAFEFSLGGLPAGWTTTAFVETLAPVVDATANLEMTPKHDHPVGPETLTVSGRSVATPSVASDAQLEVEVIHVADLAVVGMEVEAPADLLIGDNATATVRTRVTNHGPSWPTPATVDATLSGAGSGSASSSLTLAKDQVSQIEQTFSINCVGAGPQAFVFTGQISPTLSEDLDLTPANNSAEVVVEIDCVIPVALNIKPGSLTNPVNTGSRGVLPVAVLSTAAGEYGLPVDVDATGIDPLSVHLGPEAVAWAGGGALERHQRGHVEDALELDEVTLDGDLDMVLHYWTPVTGIADGETSACVRGLLDDGGSTYSFFGCDSIHTVP